MAVFPPLHSEMAFHAGLFASDEVASDSHGYLCVPDYNDRILELMLIALPNNASDLGQRRSQVASYSFIRDNLRASLSVNRSVDG